MRQNDDYQKKELPDVFTRRAFLFSLSSTLLSLSSFIVTSHYIIKSQLTSTPKIPPSQKPKIKSTLKVQTKKVKKRIQQPQGHLSPTLYIFGFVFGLLSFQIFSQLGFLVLILHGTPNHHNVKRTCQFSTSSPNLHQRKSLW